MRNMNVPVKRVFALVVGCFAMAIAGSVYSYGVYIVAVKKHFNYSQPDVELFGSTSNFGISLGFPAGLLCEKFGSRWASLVGLILSSLGYMLLWSTTMMIKFYSTNSAKTALQAIYYFVSGFGAIFLYMAAMTTNTVNFHPKHRGKIVGLLDASFSAGPALMAFIYGQIFAAGHVHDEQNQDLGGFYLTTAISFAVIGVFGVVFLGTYPYEVQENDEVVLTVNEFKIEGELEIQSGPPRKDITGLKLVRRFDYHFLAWAYIFCAGLQLMFQNNIQTYLTTFKLEQYTTMFGTVNPICGVASKFFVGFVSDLIVEKVPRVTLLLAFNVAQTIILAFCIFFSDKFPVLVVTLLVIGFANGAVWCLTPTMISEFYGLKYFGRNWGATIFGNAIGGFILQQAYGWTYNNSIRIKGAKDCKAGVHCFTWSFAMATVLSFCACIFNLGLLQGQNDNKRKIKANSEKRTEL